MNNGTISAGTYIAPAARLGTTSFDVTSVSGKFIQTVTIVVTRQVAQLARPKVKCVSYKVRGQMVHGKKKCTVKAVVPILVGGGSATLTIQRAVKVGTRTVWKAAGSCKVAASGKPVSCTKVLASGSYRVQASVIATTLHGSAVSSYVALTA
jgi:hypothetical protein